LDQVQAIWPTMRTNKIRIVTPSSTIPQVRTHEDEQQGAPPTGRMILPNTPSGEAAPAGATPDVQKKKPSEDATTHGTPRVRFMLTAQTTENPVDSDATKTEAAPPKTDKSAQNSVTDNKNDANRGAPVIVSVGPNGIMIASADTEALDQ